MKRLKQALAAIAVTAGILALAAYLGFRHHFPYGWTHHCDTALHQTLTSYALAHGGRFPAGEESPEASLSLIHRFDPSVATTLAGKSVPPEATLGRLQAGLLLDPATCGWHYVEGLTVEDDPNIALFWDKVGLNHNGGRLPEGGHSVTTIGGLRMVVPAREWSAFLQRQQELIAASKTRR